MGSPRSLNKKQVIDMIHRGESLAGADLRGSDLSGVCFDGAHMPYVKLAEANLARASFRETDLSNASLWHADCTDVCFDGANLEEADLDLSNLEGATLRGAKTRKAIFPYNRVSLEQILASVRTGKRLKVERRRGED